MFEKLTPNDFALAITNGTIIYQGYKQFTSTSDDTAWMMTFFIISFTLILCDIKCSSTLTSYQFTTAIDARQ